MVQLEKEVTNLGKPTFLEWTLPFVGGLVYFNRTEDLKYQNPEKSFDYLKNQISYLSGALTQFHTAEFIALFKMCI